MKQEREYRSMELRTVALAGEEPTYRVQGYASTFDEYVLISIDGIDYKERIEKTAFEGADLSDVVFRLEHEGRVYARSSAGTVALETDDHGLAINADLSKTPAARDVFADIEAGNYPQMSFAFVVGEEAFDYDTNTRIINRINKVFDISPVTFPANPETELHVRNHLDGVIKAAEAERLQRKEEERRDSERREELRKKITEAMSK